MKKTYELSVTTQGPAYPPSEIMNAQGDFVVIGYLQEAADDSSVSKRWGAAIVDAKSDLPPFGQSAAYQIKRELNLSEGDDGDLVLYTLPLPLACNNYPMEFAPEQKRVEQKPQASRPLHQAKIPDERPEDGRRLRSPITLRQWLRAKGELTVTALPGSDSASFEFQFTGLIAESLYTIMALREHDLDPAGPTRPGPLGIPNVFIADENGEATYRAVMPNPFPRGEGTNRIVNIVVLWMSTQMSHGGAIGYHGLGGDVHAQLKLKFPSFGEFLTGEFLTQKRNNL